MFPDYPFTAKPIGVRMGKGKGRVDMWVARVCRGKILFELDGVAQAISQKALVSASKKLPLKTVLVKKAS